MRGGYFELLGNIGLPEAQPSGHRYWRIYITDTLATTWRGDIAEIVFKDSSEQDISTGGTAFASSYFNWEGYDPRPPSNAFDKDPDTRWGVADSDTPLPGFIGYDFTQPVDVKFVDMTTPTGSSAYADRMPRDFTIQYSDDNVQWTDVISFVDEVWAEGETKSFEVIDLSSLTYEAITTDGNGTWTVPSDVTEITVECWGAGGAGGGSSNLYSAGGAGGGGAYAKSTLSVTPNSTINYHIGENSNSTADRTTWFVDNTTVLAVGGESTSSRIGGDGGSSTNCIGDISYSGGNGGNGDSYYTNPPYGGRGGSSGGPCGDGMDGPNTGGSYPTAPDCSLANGYGGVNDQGHGDNPNPGRGGEGRKDSTFGHAGYAGQIRISY